MSLGKWENIIRLSGSIKDPAVTGSNGFKNELM